MAVPVYHLAAGVAVDMAVQPALDRTGPIQRTMRIITSSSSDHHNHSSSRRRKAMTRTVGRRAGRRKCLHHRPMLDRMEVVIYSKEMVGISTTLAMIRILLHRTPRSSCSSSNRHL
jgi:hypothetical protein